MNLVMDHTPAVNRKIGLEVVPVLEGHSLWAESYDRMENPLLALEERVMDALLPAPSNAFVLDVACGTGRWLHRLLAHGAHGGLGVDLSSEMLSQASTHPALKGKLIRGHGNSLPLPDGAADLVICAFAVGYVDNLSTFASELARVARSGGSIWISDFHPEAHKLGWKRSFRHCGRTIEIRSYHRSAAEVREHLEDAGLCVLRTIDCHLGEPERKLFERAGKQHQFQGACETPAVLIMELGRESVGMVRRR